MPELPPLLSYVKNPISWEVSSIGDSISVYGLGQISGVSRGTGLLYFWIERSGIGSWGNQFVLLDKTPGEYSSPEPNKISLLSDAAARFPCSGIITGTQEGFIIAPALQLGVFAGKDLVLMFLSPDRAPHTVSADKTTLAIADEDATMTVGGGNDGIRCQGTVNGHSFRAARIVLNRNPGLPFVYREGFNETLCEISEPGPIRAEWKPVNRAFQECLLAFHPPNLNAFSMTSMFPSFDDLAQHLGAQKTITVVREKITWWETGLASVILSVW